MNQLPDTQTPVTTTATSIRILEQIKADGGTTVTEVAEDLGMAKSTAHRHLQTLQAEQLVYETDGRYKIGLRWLEFGLYARDRHPMYKVGKERVDQLSKEVDGKVWLLVEQNGMGYLIHRVMGGYPIITRDRPGKRFHLHTIAAGKAILATYSEEQINSIIDRHGLPAETENTITEKETLIHELKEIRNRGYAFNLGESVQSLNAVGTAVQDVDGRYVGAISISGNKERYSQDYIENELINQLLGAARDIELNIRHQ